MIRILLMEDTKAKASQIQETLIYKCGVLKDDIQSVRSLNEGRRVLIDNKYDLLILDLVMPTMEDGDVNEVESEQFIDEIYRMANYNKPTFILGLTQYKEKAFAEDSSFNKYLWKIIHYDVASIEWQQVLQNSINLIRNVQNENFKRYKYDCAILCALPEELSQLHKVDNIQWNVLETDEHGFVCYETVLINKYGRKLKIISTTCATAGMQSAAVAATYLYTKFHVDYIFMTGFCAGFNQNINIGDIYIAESIYDYGNGKLVCDDNGKTYLEQRLQQHECDYSLKTMFHDYMMNNSSLDSKLYAVLKSANLIQDISKCPNIKMGPGTCGSYVVNDLSFMQKQIQNNSKLLGLEMEGYGVYSSAHMLNKKCLLIKGVSDFADGTKNNKYHEMCSYASAWLLLDFLKQSRI